MKFAATLIALFQIFSSPICAESFKDVYQDYLVAEKEKDNPKTLELALKTIELGKVKYGENSKNFANLQYNLANAYAKNKQYSEAFEHMSKVSSLYKSIYGENSQQYFVSLLDQLSYVPSVVNGRSFKFGNDAEVISELSQLNKVKKQLVNQAIVIGELLIKETPENGPFIYQMLSKSFTERHIYSQVKEESKHYAQLSYQGLQEVLGNKDNATIEAKLLLASLEFGAKEYDDSAKLYEEIVSLYTQTSETSHPFELAARSSLVVIYEKLGESEKATQHCVAIGSLNPWQLNTEPLPLYRIEPSYPLKQARERTEGWAEFLFTINEQGFVVDIEALNVSGGKEFAEVGKKALKKWRYAPRIENGVAVTTPNLKLHLAFKMDRT
jgi:TonB family protein